MVIATLLSSSAHGSMVIAFQPSEWNGSIGLWKKKKKNSPLIARILVFHLFYFFADYVANADCDIQLF